MGTTKRTAWLGAILFSFGIGCGSAADGSQVASDVLAVSGSNVNGEQFALPDGDGSGARDRAGPVQKSELAQLTLLLNLSQDQIAAIQPILDATRAALEDVRAQVKAGVLSEADARARVKALHDTEKDQLLSLLTLEQQTKFTAMREHHCDAFDLVKLTAALSLSDDQVGQIRAIQHAAKTKLEEIHTQVEAGTLSQQDAHIQADQVRMDSQTAIESVLTAEQKAELDKILADRRGPDGGLRGPGGPGGPCGPDGTGGAGRPPGSSST